MVPVLKVISVWPLLLVMSVGPMSALGQERVQQRDQVQKREQQRAGRREIIPGSELMTPAERDDYRRRYAAARTEEEQAKVRTAHIGQMEERARMRGLQLAPQSVPKGGAR